MIDLRQGDCLDVLTTLPSGSVSCCVTSPPYWGLRDYGVKGQIGLEETPEAYVGRMVEVFREVKRVLADDGTLWLNLGDSYAGSNASQGGDGSRATYADGRKSLAGAMARATHRNSQVLQPKIVPGLPAKNLLGIPWRVAFALQADGWYLRSDIIWHKPNPMPESVRDRPTKAHEYLFLLTKRERYFYDADAVREPHAVPTQNRYSTARRSEAKAHGERGKGFNAIGSDYTRKTAFDPSSTGRNRRSVWTICPKPYKGAHFATFPPALVEPCILAGCPKGGVVLDPFCGSGTTGQVAAEHGRSFLGIELNGDYLKLARERLAPWLAERRAA
jgi:DNA modification methylase